MKNENPILVRDVRQMLIRAFFTQIQKPPVFDDGEPEMEREDWFLYLYPYFTFSGLKELLGLSEKEAKRIRALYYKIKRLKKNGKEFNARNRRAEIRREFFQDNSHLSNREIARVLRVSESAISKMKKRMEI